MNCKRYLVMVLFEEKRATVTASLLKNLRTLFVLIRTCWIAHKRCGVQNKVQNTQLYEKWITIRPCYKV